MLVKDYLLVHNGAMEKRSRGRPTLENGERRWLTIRVSDERLAKYQRAADKAQETLSAWVKRVLDKASK
jgi:hypothetical protein